MEILSLGEKIKKRRKELNMTLKDLAGDRITPGQISLVESGRSNPSMDLLEYLALLHASSIVISNKILCSALSERLKALLSSKIKLADIIL